MTSSRIQEIPYTSATSGRFGPSEHGAPTKTNPDNIDTTMSASSPLTATIAAGRAALRPPFGAKCSLRGLHTAVHLRGVLPIYNGNIVLLRDAPAGEEAVHMVETTLRRIWSDHRVAFIGEEHHTPLACATFAHLVRCAESRRDFHLLVEGAPLGVQPEGARPVWCSVYAMPVQGIESEHDSTLTTVDYALEMLWRLRRVKDIGPLRLRQFLKAAARSDGGIDFMAYLNSYARDLPAPQCNYLLQVPAMMDTGPTYHATARAFIASAHLEVFCVYLSSFVGHVLDRYNIVDNRRRDLTAYLQHPTLKSLDRALDSWSVLQRNAEWARSIRMLQSGSTQNIVALVGEAHTHGLATLLQEC